MPRELVLIAEGVEPYTLAYGRAALEPERFQVDRLPGRILNRLLDFFLFA